MRQREIYVSHTAAHVALWKDPNLVWEYQNLDDLRRPTCSILVHSVHHIIHFSDSSVRVPMKLGIVPGGGPRTILQVFFELNH